MWSLVLASANRFSQICEPALSHRASPGFASAPADPPEPRGGKHCRNLSFFQGMYCTRTRLRVRPLGLLLVGERAHAFLLVVLHDERAVRHRSLQHSEIKVRWRDLDSRSRTTGGRGGVQSAGRWRGSSRMLRASRQRERPRKTQSRRAWKSRDAPALTPSLPA